MSSYPDLKPYKYWGTGEISKILNVGWLDINSDFHTGYLNQKLISNLEKLTLYEDRENRTFIVNRN